MHFSFAVGTLRRKLPPMNDVTRLLATLQHGDARAGEELLPLVDAGLRGGASKHRGIHDGEHILQHVLRSALNELHFARAIIE